MTGSVTVLMAVYNGSPYLRLAIESILRQTYGDFRFVIVDDGSTDDSREIVRSYVDDRIDLLCLERNVGQTVAWNIGLRHARTPWIARMDADDYSAPTRLEKEMRLLEADRGLVCVGTWGWVFVSDPNVVVKVLPMPQSDDEIKRALLVGLPMIHGSIVVKRELLLGVGGYDERYRESADVEMYDRLLRHHRAANVPEPLLGIRRHEGKRSITMRALDELIEILSRRLANGRYTREERRILRLGLSKTCLHRARMRRRLGKPPYLSLADYARAFWFYPPWLIRAL